MDLDEFRRRAREGIAPDLISTSCETCGALRFAVYSKARGKHITFRHCRKHLPNPNSVDRIMAEHEDVCWRCHGDRDHLPQDDDGYCIECIGYAVGMTITAKLPSGDGYVKGTIRDIQTIDPDGPCAGIEVTRCMKHDVPSDEIGLWKPIDPGTWSLWVSLGHAETRQPKFGPDRFGGECEHPGCTEAVTTVNRDGARWCSMHMSNVRCIEDGCKAEAIHPVGSTLQQTSFAKAPVPTHCEDHYFPF